MTRKSVLLSIGAALVVTGVAGVFGYVGIEVGRRLEYNARCCLLGSRTFTFTLAEVLGLSTYYSQSGQDKWLTEIVFPDVTNGYFLDVGSGDGTEGSNTKLIETWGWAGICIDPLPENMQDRTCQLFKEVVLDQPGQKVQFTMAGQLSGVSSDLGAYKDYVARSPTVELTTTTLGDILERAHAPEYIHYMSLDIEGAELKALQGLPLDKYTFGALNIEHNGEEPKRSDILALLTRHGYTRTHTWFQDDYYVHASPGTPR